MPATNDKLALRFDTLLISSRGISEVHGQKVVVFVPADDIERITLRFGKSDHRPLVSIAIGIILGLVGIFGLVEFFLAMRGYRYELGMMAFGVIGGSLIFDALKERYFFEVHRKNGRVSRLVLSKDAQKSNLDEFCNSARTTYQYLITDAS